MSPSIELKNSLEQQRKTKGKKRILKVLRDNDYLSQFIKFCDKKRKQHSVNTNGNSRTTDANNRANPADYLVSYFVILPYIKDITEYLGR